MCWKSASGAGLPAHCPRAHSMAHAERGQGTGGLADAIRPGGVVAAVGHMRNTQTFASRQQVSNRCGSSAPNGI